mmetsp:Transcript_1370/g.3987  ORF Transcript_1370/g.3987 Transcript_1370/m.3987 type:complete len:146 (-) Transcript_1370:168-605(-)
MRAATRAAPRLALLGAVLGTLCHAALGDLSLEDESAAALAEFNAAIARQRELSSRILRRAEQAVADGDAAAAEKAKAKAAHLDDMSDRVQQSVDMLEARKGAAKRLAHYHPEDAMATVRARVPAIRAHIKAEMAASGKSERPALV